MADETAADARSDTLRVAFVPGVMPDRWAARWRQSHPIPLELVPTVLADQFDVLDSGRAEMCFLRLPVDRDDLHLVRLYEEEVCVVAGTEHPISAFTELSVAELAGEHLLVAPDSVTGWTADVTVVDAPDLTTARAVETVATGTGVVVLPRSVARLHHRKDAVVRPVVDLGPAPVALAWLRTADPDRESVRQDFVGVVRGRTARSSRTTTPTTGPARSTRRRTTRPEPRVSHRKRRRR